MQSLSIYKSSIKGYTISRWSKSCAGNYVGFRRQLRALLGPNVQVVGPDELEHGVVLGDITSVLSESVPIYEFRQEDLDLLQRKVEPDTHARASSKG